MRDEEEFTVHHDARSESADRIADLADAARKLHELPRTEHLYTKVLEMLEAEFQPAVELRINPSASSSDLPPD